MESNFELYKQWAERAAKRLAEEERNKGAKPEDRNAGEPLVQPVNLNIKGAQFLEGDFGKKVHEHICRDYASSPDVFNSVNFSDGIVKGSKPFYSVAVNETLAKLGIKNVRTANQAELEKILKANSLGLKDHYEDSSLVYRTDANPNEYLAKHLSKQLKARGIKLDSPIVVPLYCFKLDKDDKSPHGVSFKLKDDAEIIKAPILKSKSGSYISSADFDENTGLPTKVYAKQTPENRQLWTRDSGLSRLYLDRNLIVSSDDDYLASSSGSGRVVLISAEGATRAKN